MPTAVLPTSRELKRHASALALLVGAMLLLQPATGRASLIGDTVRCDDGGSGVVCSSASALVLATGGEFNGRLKVEVRASTIVVSNFSTDFFQGSGQTVVISDLDFSDGGGPITGVTIHTSFVSPAPLVTFTADSVTIHLGASVWLPTAYTTTFVSIQLNRVRFLRGERAD